MEIQEERTQVVTTATATPTTQRTYQTKKTIFRAYQVIWYILGVIEVLLAFRFVLKLLGANPLSGFVSFIYSLSALFVAPFYGILGNPSVSGSVLEWSTIIAGIVYFVIAWGIVYLFQLIKPVSPTEVSQVVDNP